MLSFTLVITEKDIETLATAANEVWHEYFRSILALEQIDYMVKKFQSVPALTYQIKCQSYQYYILNDNETPTGYIGIHPESNRLFLSKIYLLKPYRKKGFASLMLKKVEEIARKTGKSSIYLTVNKYNTNSKEVYEHKGFNIIDSTVTDIGGGFVMDDYVMEKILK